VIPGTFTPSDGFTFPLVTAELLMIAMVASGMAGSLRGVVELPGVVSGGRPGGLQDLRAPDPFARAGAGCLRHRNGGLHRPTASALAGRLI